MTVLHPQILTETSGIISDLVPLIKVIYSYQLQQNPVPPALLA